MTCTQIQVDLELEVCVHFWGKMVGGRLDSVACIRITSTLATGLNRFSHSCYSLSWMTQGSPKADVLQTTIYAQMYGAVFWCLSFCALT